MYRDGVEIRTEDGIHFVLAHCALGDGITSLPAICWARKMHTFDMKMTVWAPTHMLPLFEHLIGGPGLRFRPMDEFKTFWAKGDPEGGAVVINSVHRNPVTRNRTDMVDFAFMTMLDRQVDDISEKNYPHWAPLGPRPHEAPYVVLPVGATNDASVFHPKSLVPFIEWLLDTGRKPIITGAHNTHVHTLVKGKPELLVVRDLADQIPADLYAECLDLRNKTTLMELRDWCGHADAVVGIDGGTLHLAGTTDVPIVYGCTRVSPRHRPIVRHDELNWKCVHVEPRDLECAGCQSNWTLMFRFSFSDCAYKDHKCVEMIDAEDLIDAMEALDQGEYHDVGNE